MKNSKNKKSKYTIELEKEENRILNIIKAENDLKNKSQAVSYLIRLYLKKHKS